MKMKTPEEFFNEHYQYPNSQIELCSRESVIHALKCYKEHLVTDEVSSGVRLSSEQSAFNAGFDEGYTSPLERDGKRVTILDYQNHRQECYDVWVSLGKPEPDEA